MKSYTFSMNLLIPTKFKKKTMKNLFLSQIIKHFWQKALPSHFQDAIRNCSSTRHQVHDNRAEQQADQMHFTNLWFLGDLKKCCSVNQVNWWTELTFIDAFVFRVKWWTVFGPSCKHKCCRFSLTFHRHRSHQTKIRVLWPLKSLN